MCVCVCVCVCVEGVCGWGVCVCVWRVWVGGVCVCVCVEGVGGWVQQILHIIKVTEQGNTNNIHTTL